MAKTRSDFGNWPDLSMVTPQLSNSDHGYGFRQFTTVHTRAKEVLEDILKVHLIIRLLQVKIFVQLQKVANMGNRRWRWPAFLKANRSRLLWREKIVDVSSIRLLCRSEWEMFSSRRTVRHNIRISRAGRMKLKAYQFR
jgi:hypothetical protein